MKNDTRTHGKLSSKFFSEMTVFKDRVYMNMKAHKKTIVTIILPKVWFCIQTLLYSPNICNEKQLL